MPKGKAPDYYHKTRRGLGYVTTLVSSDQESDKCTLGDHSSGTSPWDFDVSIGDIFRTLSVNMTTISHLEDEDEDEGEELIQSDTDPWNKYLNILWDIRFE